MIYTKLPFMPGPHTFTAYFEKIEGSESSDSQSPLIDTEFTSGSASPRLSAEWDNFNTAKQTPVLVLSSVFMLLVGLLTFASGLWLHTLAKAHCLRELPLIYIFAAPVLRDIDTSLHDVRYNGSVVGPGLYKGPLNPDFDDRWDALELVDDVIVNKDAMIRSGLSINSVQVPKRLGIGEGYVVGLEVTHQLHCLNFIRKSLWFNWDYYQDKSGEFTDDLPIVHMHLDHCVDMIRQVLMCNADVGIVPYRWVRDYPRPYPDFSTVHKCRNYDSVLEWAVKNKFRKPTGFELHEPSEGDFVFDSAPLNNYSVS